MAHLWESLFSHFSRRDKSSVTTQETSLQDIAADYPSDINWERIQRLQEEFDFPNQRLINEEDTCLPSEIPPSALDCKPSDFLTSCPQCYIVLDVETTGLSPESDDIIEFGAIKIENGQETDCFNTFIDPGYPIPPYITQITGITDTDVAGSPDLLTAIKDIAAFISDFPIVAHNATFDLRFLFCAYQKAGMQTNFHYIDTLTLARHAFPELPSHRLSILIDYLGINGTQEHRALSDVRFTYQIFCACCACLTHMDLSLFALPYPSTRSQRRKQYRARARADMRDIECQKSTPDPNHPFYQKKLVFTGTLKIPRVQAAQMAVDRGAVLSGSVSKKTDYLIVGEQDPALVGESIMSSKEKRAIALNDSGEACIHIIREEEFLRLLYTDSGV